MPDLEPASIRFLIAASTALLIGLAGNWAITRLLPNLAGRLVSRAESATNDEHYFRIRRQETILRIFAAGLRLLLAIVLVLAVWQLATPTSEPVALIGASAFFIVIGAATIGTLLRDLTSGTAMIAEQWYNVGDHIAVEPFMNLSGVVEDVNLRSTKLRSLNGEIVWIHNQFIQAVRIAPRGLRTMSIDIFVTDAEAGRALFEHVISTLPVGPTMFASPLAIFEEEELGEITRISAKGQTAPERQWLIEDFAVRALKKFDEETEGGPFIVFGPIVRNTDESAERYLKRSIRIKERRSEDR